MTCYSPITKPPQSSQTGNKGSKAPHVSVDDTVYSFKDHVILNILNLMDISPYQFNILASWYVNI